jgi:hypothetical protein
MMQTKAEQLAAHFRQMRELNEYGKASVQDVADELERLSPMEAERDKLLAINKVLVDALNLLDDVTQCSDFVQPTEYDAAIKAKTEALKLAGEIK